MSLPRLALAGEASYSFYIIHEPLMIVAAIGLHRIWPTRSHHAFEFVLLLTIVPIGAIAWWMFTRIETPINRWARARFRGTPTTFVTAA
jgi:peptidoglycan/LPS O-acetylase OafA/YrhL